MTEDEHQEYEVDGYFNTQNSDYLAERLPGEHVIQYCWRSIITHLRSVEDIQKTPVTD